jgi:hypothetical protein
MKEEAPFIGRGYVSRERIMGASCGGSARSRPVVVGAVFHFRLVSTLVISRMLQDNKRFV